MLRKLALAGASLVLVTGLLELGMRLGRFEIHDFLSEQRKYLSLLQQDQDGGYFIHPAGASVVVSGVSARFNSLGLRDDEPRLPKPAGVFRILCLGDSVVFGSGVAQDAIFPVQLRALFAGQPIDVVAAGVQGWNTGQEERFLAANIARIDPDLVLLLYVVNDNEPTPPWEKEHAARTRLRDTVYRTLVLHSRLFEWVAFLRLRRPQTVTAPVPRPASPAAAPAAAPSRPPAYSPDDPGWLASRDALRRIDSLVRAHGARLVVWLYSMNDREPEPSARARLGELAAESGIAVRDTRSYFAGHAPAALVNAPIVDPHPNAAGHALLAAGLARALRDEGLVPSSRDGARVGAE